MASTGAILATTSVIPGAALDTDASRRKTRKDRGISAILHTSMPIRYWDHELDDLSPRLVVTDPSGENASQLSDLATDADAVNLLNASVDISPDGTTIATSWTRRAAGAETVDSLVLIDTLRGRRKTLVRGTVGNSFGSPLFLPERQDVGSRAMDDIHPDGHLLLLSGAASAGRWRSGGSAGRRHEYRRVRLGTGR